ncbi:hypothetical protein QWY28_19080 [Nocardioides sp. SOB77]|uniref:Uncharacterized protein n=1 Tax=Nocardioides oceani TaxID=3058369 RepID=A0ABT8FKN1_9ACTN|nr:hypothetical protein [Nocardioides oceani]MDN4175076.1 hypothetical protein [Nocardioides oceani]
MRTTLPGRRDAAVGRDVRRPAEVRVRPDVRRAVRRSVVAPCGPTYAGPYAAPSSRRAAFVAAASPLRHACVTGR